MKSEKPATETVTVPPASFYRAQGYLAQESVGYLMRRIVNHLAQEVERRMEPNGLTNAQWVPLLKLQQGQASSVAELARTCDLDAGAMTRLLDRLETKGLCRRVRSSEDRRVVNLELTQEGSEAAKAIPAVLSTIQNECLAGFSKEEWESLKGYLRRILDTAQSLHPSAEKNDK
ncbi:MarR family transcriptional regulator [Polaromonas sp.]|uniref:MarR family winged helix-turn-helix transcriptional regulator n=1 Tax=Polaromonas sp. TaxID=1869339 RepID=UPI0024872561|nr:MarR family transcriptional regulator [Polaromonas sp.]MDI1273268.1 MarR family transcriptional regulator [Polaromonas sp.]